jgi:hypothetical protein
VLRMLLHVPRSSFDGVSVLTQTAHSFCAMLSESRCNGRLNGKSGVRDAELQEEKVVVSSP